METKPDKKLGHWILNKKSKVQCLMSNVCSRRSAVCGLPPSLRLPASLKLRWTRRRTCRSDSRGFSLLELMTVMLLMFIMMGISTVAMRGVIRGAGLRGAITTTRGAFIQARQYAMMNGRPAAVIMEQEDGKPGRMRTIASYGKVAIVKEGNVIETESGLPWTSSEIAGANVFNFAGDEGVFETKEGIEDSNTEFVIDGFGKDDRIALEVGTMRELHAGMEFDEAPKIVIFDPDGSSQGGTGIHVSEIGGDGGFSVRIYQLTGKVTVTMD